MQAIVTRYHGPTNTRAARISARTAAGRCSIPYPHEAGGLGAAHRAAALALIAKLGWQEHVVRFGLVQGGMPDQSGDVFVFGDDPVQGVKS